MINSCDNFKRKPSFLRKRFLRSIEYNLIMIVVLSRRLIRCYLLDFYSYKYKETVQGHLQLKMRKFEKGNVFVVF